ncbi:hypothetical protein APHAL10511_004473 [Amanita phalloides]|nr:hypothetical protein APHAL10511_004473 [Amanita phalloides]
MVLHPWHKLAYFQKAQWLSAWIELAETLVRDEYECYTSISEAEDEVEEGEGEPDVGSMAACNKQKEVNVFDQLPALAPLKPSDLRSELDQYLSSDIEDVTDALSWWYKRRTTFPWLTRMALDYLSIPHKFCL